MRILIAFLLLTTAVKAQTVFGQQVKTTTEIIFYVKENEDSPYQGRLVFSPDEIAKLDDKQIAQMQLDQFATWKKNLEALRNQPEPTADDKAAMVLDLEKQAAELKADPAVQAALDAIEAKK